MSTPITRRDFIRDAVALSAAATLSPTVVTAASRPRKLVDAGWCWDGQGFNGGVNPSIFGAGEGTRWFGLNKVCFMFHPNNPLAMGKLHGFKEVVFIAFGITSLFRIRSRMPLIKLPDSSEPYSFPSSTASFNVTFGGISSQ